MNLLKRLKLKAMLRNCDYILAGTVIKQQYYDVNKNTEINRLIDKFMANPCFEEALTLISYNDFMVFYFTESCTDGLYVRKSSQEPLKAVVEPPTPDEHSFSLLAPAATYEHTSSGMMKDSELDGSDRKKQAGMPNPEEDDLKSDPTKSYKLTLNKDKQEAAASVDLEFLQSNSFEEPKELSDKARHLKQIIQESEEWMEQVIAKRQQKKPETPSFAKVKPALDVNENAAAIELKYKELESAAIAKMIQEKMEGTISIEMNLNEHENTAATEQKAVKPEITAAVESKQVTSTDKPKQERQAPEPKLPQPHAVTTEPVAVPSRVAKMMHASFPNVVATLKIDIHTMSKQLDDYRKQLSFSPLNDKELKAWIQSLEEAIQEFSLALDLLEEED